MVSYFFKRAKCIPRLKEASRLWEAGEHAEAESQLRKILQQDPQNPQANEQLKQIEKWKKQQEKARKRLRKIEKAETQIDPLRRRLLNLGFIPKVLSEAREASEEAKNTFQQRAAARLLALWFGKLKTEEGARLSLQAIAKAKQGEKDPDLQRKAAVMEAEALAILGNQEGAEGLLLGALKSQEHEDLCLALANLETSLEKRIYWINRALSVYGLSPLTCREEEGLPAFDRLQAEKKRGRPPRGNIQAGPLVSVIVPAYQAELTIDTALESLLNQTWWNLEVWVVDDGSSDNTLERAEAFRRKDSRVQVIASQHNRGPFVARNLALQAATGDLVCCHDTDDWSHPEMLETQVLHLLDNPEAIANISQQARATSDLKFYRRTRYGNFVYNNVPSFMFRRRPVMENLGFWDSVRFSGDAEMIRRVRQFFGSNRVENLATGPLCFQRQHAASLTAHEHFGGEYYYVGARKEYFEAQRYYHRRAPHLYYSFPQRERPFPVPEPMRPQREVDASGRRHLDVIHAGDFRIPSSITRSVAEELSVQRRQGLRSGVFQLAQYPLNPKKHITPGIRELIDGDQIQFLVYGERVSCKLLLIHGPKCLEEWQKFIPEISPGEVRVIVDEPPRELYHSSQGGKGGSYCYFRCRGNLQEYLAGRNKVFWHPASPLVGEAIFAQGEQEGEKEEINKNDDIRPRGLFSTGEWKEDPGIPVLEADNWKRNSRLQHQKIVIGRHARDHKENWPDTPEDLRAIYPSEEEYQINILGGVKTPRKILGDLPDNWRVFSYGTVSAREFLSGLDVFVFYPHSQAEASSGRAILEAMAVGVPVVCPPFYRKMFEDAALYADPPSVKDTVEELVKDEEWYRRTAENAQEFVKARFNAGKHLERLRSLEII